MSRRILRGVWRQQPPGSGYYEDRGCSSQRLKFFRNEICLIIVSIFVTGTRAWCPEECTCKLIPPPTVGTDFLLGNSLNDTMVVSCSSRNLSKTPSKLDPIGVEITVLDLSSNVLKSVPKEMIPSSLLELNLEGNLLSRNPAKDLPFLQNLNLGRNVFTKLKDDEFSGLTALRVLDLSGNNLTEIPAAVKKAFRIKQLRLENNQISHVGESALEGLQHLELVDLQGNPIATLDRNAFRGLPSLQKLILEEAKGQDVFPNLEGNPSLEIIRLDRGSIKSVPDRLCSVVHNLTSLNLHLNQINVIPRLTECRFLKLLDLSNNRISMLIPGIFQGMSSLHDLLLQHNNLRSIPKDAFVGLLNLQVLNLESNLITSIDTQAFVPLKSLEDINLGNNYFPNLPSAGLQHVVSLKVHNNRHLRVFPGPEHFPAIHNLVLSYAYHCCPFIGNVLQNDFNSTGVAIFEDVVFNLDVLRTIDPDIWNHSDVWPHIESMSSNSLPISSKLAMHSLPASGLQRTYVNDNESVLDVVNNSGVIHYIRRHHVHCIPQPGPFMPCEDLFDWWTLRCGVWLVFLLALMGNGVVVIVLVAAYSKMDVPRFLVTNLALADFFMGVYLGILAVVDASTLGEFKMYAIPWQMSAGCQVAGFLGVLSSELSVYTLAVITLERNYAITHAVHLNKRLSLQNAAYIMIVGWIFALTMAVMPLLGISDFRKFAVCLPFETNGAGLGYVVFLMFINGVAFLILMGCYFKIYCAIRGSHAWNSNDSRIAKRMAMLVFTDFICWAPIAFFSLSAAFGLQLISLEWAKVFTVFILPLNSCCNPFLYALLTKQFKKDCIMLCKAIEESRVTRGMGRCRHSANFSNRQTPANTNSALDQTSREDQQHHCNCQSHADHHHKLRPSLKAFAGKYLCCQLEIDELTSTTDTGSQPIGSPGKKSVSNQKANDAGSVAAAGTGWRRKDHGTATLRLLELRQHASLDLTRKSSQESNTSSRNDFSGTSNSTVTWRLTSRSSVSSDGSCGSGRGYTQSGTQKGDCQKDKAYSSRQGSIQKLKEKPRLQRQRAIEKDPYFITKTLLGDDISCPLHPRVDHLSCVYEQDSIEEDDPSVKSVPRPYFPSPSRLLRSLSDSHLFKPLLGSFSNRTKPQVDSEMSTVSDRGRVLETHFPLKKETDLNTK